MNWLSMIPVQGMGRIACCRPAVVSTRHRARPGRAERQRVSGPPTDWPGNRPSIRPPDQPDDQPDGLPTNQTKRPISRPINQPAHRQPDRPTDRARGRPTAAGGEELFRLRSCKLTQSTADSGVTLHQRSSPNLTRVSVPGNKVICDEVGFRADPRPT